MTFAWKPGTSPNTEAIARLKQHFPKPEQPPPVAWFMGGITYHHFITKLDPADFDYQPLKRYLSDTETGLRCFPEVEFAIKSWKETFHYLLPHMVCRIQKDYFDERYLLQQVIGYFMQVHPENIPDIYPQFRDDVLTTLGTAIMAPLFWNADDLSSLVVEEDRQYWLRYATDDFLCVLSSALFFCLKYLPSTEMTSWFESLMQIKGIHWHYNFMLWLKENTFVFSFFEEDDLPEVQSIPAKAFGDGTLLPEITLPTQNMRQFISLLKQHGIYYG